MGRLFLSLYRNQFMEIGNWSGFSSLEKIFRKNYITILRQILAEKRFAHADRIRMFSGGQLVKGEGTMLFSLKRGSWSSVVLKIFEKWFLRNKANPFPVIYPSTSFSESLGTLLYIKDLRGFRIKWNSVCDHFVPGRSRRTQWLPEDTKGHFRWTKVWFQKILSCPDMDHWSYLRESHEFESGRPHFDFLRFS